MFHVYIENVNHLRKLINLELSFTSYKIIIIVTSELSSRINSPVLLHEAVQQLLHRFRVTLRDQVPLQISEVFGLHQHPGLAALTKEVEHCVSNLE